VAARNVRTLQPAMHDRRYRDAGSAAFAPILDRGSAILDHCDSFARIFR
jgi:hypothetical protein